MFHSVFKVKFASFHLWVLNVIWIYAVSSVSDACRFEKRDGEWKGCLWSSCRSRSVFSLLNLMSCSCLALLKLLLGLIYILNREFDFVCCLTFGSRSSRISFGTADMEKKADFSSFSISSRVSECVVLEFRYL